MAPLYEPQLARLVKSAPAGTEWIHEVKFDGYRIGGHVRAGSITLISRNGTDWTARFPEIARAIRALGARDALIDGEVAVVLPDGRTSFQALQNVFTGQSRHGLGYFVFDLLRLEGRDLRRPMGGRDRRRTVRPPAAAERRPRELSQDDRRQGAARGGSAAARGRLAGLPRVLACAGRRPRTARSRRLHDSLCESRPRKEDSRRLPAQQQNEHVRGCVLDPRAAGAPVSVPLRWQELTATPDPRAFTLLTLERRLARLRGDPWAGYWKTRQRLTPRIADALN